MYQVCAGNYPNYANTYQIYKIYKIYKKDKIILNNKVNVNIGNSSLKNIISKYHLTQYHHIHTAQYMVVPPLLKIT